MNVEMEDFQRNKSERVNGVSLSINLDLVRSTADQSNSFESRIRIAETPQRRFLTRGLSYTDDILDDKHRRIFQEWYMVFIISCVFALLIDPIFCYVLVINGDKECLYLDKTLAITAIILRSFTDLIYVVHVVVKFRFGLYGGYQASKRGDLLQESWERVRRNLLASFLMDVLAILPVPQVILLGVIPGLNYQGFEATMSMKFVILLQYVPRIYRIHPLHQNVTLISHRGERALWAKALFNLFLYILASHVFGAFWYLFAVERKATCWQKAYREYQGCDGQHQREGHRNHIAGCELLSLHCNDNVQENAIMKKFCAVNPQTNQASEFDFGIFAEALQPNLGISSNFLRRMFYSLLWGLQHLSSLGQNLKTSSNIWEICFAVLVSISGLVLFAFLIGNMQVYLQSKSQALEHLRLEGDKIELWMAFHSLPRDLKRKIRRYQSYVWEKSKGIDVESLLHSLPRDLRRCTTRHLCKDLVKKVSDQLSLQNMGTDQLLDEICDHLKPMLYTERSNIIRERDLLDEMLYVTRGKLWTYVNGSTDHHHVIETSTSTNPTHTGCLGNGDIYGEELFGWALNSLTSSPPHNLPFSTKTLRAQTNVEAFVLSANDLLKLVSKYRRFLNKKPSPSKAASIIQLFWRFSRKGKKKDKKSQLNTSSSSSTNTIVCRKSFHRCLAFKEESSCSSGTSGAVKLMKD